MNVYLLQMRQLLRVRHFFKESIHLTLQLKSGRIQMEILANNFEIEFLFSVFCISNIFGLNRTVVYVYPN